MTAAIRGLVLLISLGGCGDAPPVVLGESVSVASAELPADSRIRRSVGRGTIEYLKGPNLSRALEEDPDFRAIQRAGDAEKIVRAFLERYAKAFVLERPADELSLRSVETDGRESTHVYFQQQYSDLEIHGAELAVHLDADNHVVFVMGRTFPTPTHLDLTPALSLQQASRSVAQELGIVGDGCEGCEGELVLFAPGEEELRPAYRFEVAQGLAEAWVLFIDAQTGEVLQRFSTVQSEQRGLNFESMPRARRVEE